MVRRYAMITGAMIVALLLATLGWLLAAPVDAQSGGGYELIRNTTASSSLATASGYAVSASAGQSDAGDSSGSGYALSGGFWGGSSTNSNPWHRIYIPYWFR